MEWRQPTSAEWLIGLRQAEVQHAFVAHLRRTLRESGLTQVALSRGGADAEGPPLFPYKRLNDCINGHKRMSLADMQRVELITGPILEVLRVERTVIQDPLLRSQYPRAVGNFRPPASQDRVAVIGKPVRWPGH